jgi:hypothetical protein
MLLDALFHCRKWSEKYVMDGIWPKRESLVPTRLSTILLAVGYLERLRATDVEWMRSCFGRMISFIRGLGFGFRVWGRRGL